jgi:hypothetical protein
MNINKALFIGEGMYSDVNRIQKRKMAMGDLK